MNIHCNTGIATTDQVGDLAGYGTAWYDRKGIANILSVRALQSTATGSPYDSSDGEEFTVHKALDGKHAPVFKQSTRGLYYMDTSESAANNKDGTVMVNTVADNRTQLHKPCLLPRSPGP
jgi:hypothetical protein